MHSRITDVIFDLDGTLIDSAPSILACFAAVLEIQGIESTVPLTEALIGPPLRQTLCKLSGVEDGARLEAMIEDFKQHYDGSGYRATTVFAGVDQMLQELTSEGFRLHIATNKRDRPTRLILHHLGWSSLFCAVYASDSRQPLFGSKAEMLSALLKSENISTSGAVYVGDRSDDWVAATENALEFIAATWGYRDALLLSRGEINRATSAKEISSILAGFCSSADMGTAR